MKDWIAVLRDAKNRFSVPGKYMYPSFRPIILDVLNTFHRVGLAMKIP